MGGDFNIYTSTEDAYSNLISGSGVTLVDPLPTGNYHNNSAFASIHTQSTRTVQIDGGATGGMDDRFDYILHGPDISSGANGVTLVPGSYWAYGQDGNRFNGELLDTPTNTTVPADVLSALYYMSDHLPIYCELALDVPVAVIETEEIPVSWVVEDGQSQLQFQDPFDGEVTLMNGAGQLLYSGSIVGSSADIDLSTASASGIYFLKLANERAVSTIKFVHP